MTAAPGSLKARLVDAMAACMARWGLHKTGLDDVAREAGCSRATVYRAFPGGKDALVAAVAVSELDRFFAGVGARVDAATNLEDLVVAGVAEAGTRILGHEALRHLLAYEPEVVLPQLAFDRMDDVLAACTAFAVPYLERFVDAETAARAADWLVRIVVSYASWPGPELDLTDEASVRTFVRTYVLPGLAPASALDQS